MPYSVIITGTTGMVGKGVLLECIDAKDIEKILLINRSSVGIKHAKIKELLVNDFFNLDQVKEEMTGFHACFFCLGISSIGQREENYAKITHDLTLNFARQFKEKSPKSIFCYVSGAGTDSSEKGRSMWARVKGKTENDLFKLGFNKAYMFRPGYIQPLRGIKSKTGWYQAIYNVFSPIYLILKHFPSTATNTINIGLSMIKTLPGNYPNIILNNKEINQLSNVKNKP